MKTYLGFQLFHDTVKMQVIEIRPLFIHIDALCFSMNLKAFNEN